MRCIPLRDQVTDAFFANTYGEGAGVQGGMHTIADRKAKPLQVTKNRPVADGTINFVNVYGEERAYAARSAAWEHHGRQIFPTIFYTWMWTEVNVSWMIPPVALKPPSEARGKHTFEEIGECRRERDRPIMYQTVRGLARLRSRHYLCVLPRGRDLPGSPDGITRTEEPFQSSTINVVEDLIPDTIRAKGYAQFGVIDSHEKITHGRRVPYTVKVRLARKQTGFRGWSRGTDERDRRLVERLEDGLGQLWCQLTRSTPTGEARTGRRIRRRQPVSAPRKVRL